MESGTIDIAIPDSTGTSNGVLAVLTITEADVLSKTGGEPDIALESVVVYLDLAHASRGDLQIVLTSPQGTASILAPSKRPENTILNSDQRWKVRNVYFRALVSAAMPYITDPKPNNICVAL